MSKNGRTRILFTGQEIEAIHALARDSLRGEITTRPRDETLITLGGVLIKTARASQRLKASVTA